MIRFMVIERTGSRPEDWQGHGSQEFAAAPQKGDFITKDDEKGIGQTYEVIAAVHPMTPASTAGDLLIRHVGSIMDWKRTL